jgi:16S rRNA (uracil1498-N3)-methyltransferase
MDLIVRQAVEAGISWIVPVESERSVPMAGDFTAKRDRWMRIAREALQQSGNPLLPEIREPLPLREAVREPGVAGGIGLFFHQERLSKDSLHGALAGLAGDGSAHVSLLIGPEGGLSDDEVEFLKGAGFRPVFLGDTVLRTETAAVYAIAAVKTLLWERDEWTLSV